jgi:hypothetical protein
MSPAYDTAEIYYSKTDQLMKLAIDKKKRFLALKH